MVILSFILTACGPLKYKPVDAKKVSPNVDERVKRNIEEGRGVRLFGGQKKGGTFDFASSNFLWRAALDTIDFMPLASANYSGGIIITDWYSENNQDDLFFCPTVRNMPVRHGKGEFKSDGRAVSFGRNMTMDAPK